MRDLKKIEKRAFDLGIVDEYEKEDNFETYTFTQLHNRMIELGQQIGSYREALITYYNFCLIDESDLILLRDTRFSQLLEDELNCDNYFGSLQDKINLF